MLPRRILVNKSFKIYGILPGLTDSCHEDWEDAAVFQVRCVPTPSRERKQEEHNEATVLMEKQLMITAVVKFKTHFMTY